MRTIIIIGVTIIIFTIVIISIIVKINAIAVYITVIIIIIIIIIIVISFIIIAITNIKSFTTVVVFLAFISFQWTSISIPFIHAYLTGVCYNFSLLPNFTSCSMKLKMVDLIFSVS